MIMRHTKKFLFSVLSIALLITTFGSCTSKEEKLYGKILTKDKTEKELISRVQNAYFEINDNVTLKEAIAANTLAKNVTWSIQPLEELGTYLVSFQYDIEPIEQAMRMDFFDDSTVGKIFFVRDFYTNHTADEIEYFHAYTEGDVLSPIGYANIFTRFIKGEIVTPHNYGKEEMQGLLDAYTEYRKDYENISVFIPIKRLPETLPEPFFVPTAAKFIGDCYIELRSDEVEFIQFSILFDFKLPYMDNKEYKGVGITINDITGFSPLRRYESINTLAGLEFVYHSIPIGMIYPYASRAVIEGAQ
jgi:hypothetical protein